MKKQFILQKKHFITYQNKTKHLIDWAQILDIKYETLRCRLFRSKWTIKKAFNTPVKK